MKPIVRFCAIAVTAVVIGLAVYSRVAKPPPAAAPSTPPTAPLGAGAGPSLAGLVEPSNAPVATAASAAPQRVAAVSATPIAPARAIGSEGYGPHIEAAHSSGDPALALEAFRWMQACATVEPQLKGLQQAKDALGSMSPFDATMRDLELQGRRCQTVTAAHQAWAVELVTTAYEAHVPGAAAELSFVLARQHSDRPALDLLVAAIRNDADAGDLSSIRALGNSPGDLHIPLEDRAVYTKLFWDLTAGQHFSGQQWKALLYGAGVDPAVVSLLDVPSIEARADELRAALARKGIMRGG